MCLLWILFESYFFFILNSDDFEIVLILAASAMMVGFQSWQLRLLSVSRSSFFSCLSNKVTHHVSKLCSLMLRISAASARHLSIDACIRHWWGCRRISFSLCLVVPDWSSCQGGRRAVGVSKSMMLPSLLRVLWTISHLRNFGSLWINASCWNLYPCCCLDKPLHPSTKQKNMNINTWEGEYVKLNFFRAFTLSSSLGADVVVEPEWRPPQGRHRSGWGRCQCRLDGHRCWSGKRRC